MLLPGWIGDRRRKRAPQRVLAETATEYETSESCLFSNKVEIKVRAWSSCRETSFRDNSVYNEGFIARGKIELSDTERYASVLCIEGMSV